MEIEIKCCNKEMISLNVVDYLNNNTLEIIRFVCGECGTFKDIHTYTLDEEVILNECEIYEELKDTPIYKKLLVEDKFKIIERR